MAFFNARVLVGIDRTCPFPTVVRIVDAPRHTHRFDGFLGFVCNINQINQSGSPYCPLLGSMLSLLFGGCFCIQTIWYHLLPAYARSLQSCLGLVPSSIVYLGTRTFQIMQGQQKCMQSKKKINSIAKKKAYSTEYSQAVTRPSTNSARCCLASVIRRELVFSTWSGRRQNEGTQKCKRLWV